MSNGRSLLTRGAYLYRRSLATASDRLNSGLIRLGNRVRLNRLNEWQTAFCAWQAEQLGLPEDRMRDRFLTSLNAVRGGHGGGDYRRFGALSYAIYLPFASDDEGAVVDAYQFHKHQHFLRMLSYHVPKRPDNHPLHLGLADRTDIRVIDFGCGLAQKSISLLRWARAQGKSTHLSLADVSDLQLSFLAWFCARQGIAAETFLCDARHPFPTFAPADVLFAEEVLEHVHDPVGAIDALAPMIAPGGFIVANVSVHEAEFMHVSPNLTAARARLLALGYVEIEPNHIFRNPAQPVQPPTRELEFAESL